MKLIGMEVVETPLCGKQRESTLVYWKIGSGKHISDIFYSHMLHHLEKAYQWHRFNCLLSLLVPQLPVTCSTCLRIEDFLSFFREKSLKHFGHCLKLAWKSAKKELFKTWSNPKRCANEPNGFVGTWNGKGLPSVTVSLNILTKKFRENQQF